MFIILSDEYSLLCFRISFIEIATVEEDLQLIYKKDTFMVNFNMYNNHIVYLVQSTVLLLHYYYYIFSIVIVFVNEIRG